MSKKEKFMRSNRKTSIYIIIFFILFIFGSIKSSSIDLTVFNKENIVNEIEKIDSVKMDSIHKDSILTLKTQLKKELIDETEKWIKKKHPNSHQGIPSYLVEVGLEKDIDICFMMSQTQLETNYGQLGIGKMNSKKSLFGVYRRFPNYHESIDYYSNLLLTSYLVNGKTENDLMKNYVNKNGKRYAENRKYESHLIKVYKEIVNMTNIQKLQIQYNNLI